MTLNLRPFPLLVIIFLFSDNLVVCSQASIPSPAAAGAEKSTAYDRAFKLFERGQLNDAMAIVDLALSRDPSNPLLHNLRGLISSRLGRISDAESSFRKVIQILPDSTMGYNNLAGLLSLSGHSSEADVLFREALKREPGNSTALLGLGVTLAAGEKYAEAATYLEKAWVVHAGDFQTGYELARVLRELRRPAEARKILEQLSPPQDAPLAAKFYTLLAIVSEDLRDRAGARRLYLKAYQLAPNSFEIYISLVRASLDVEGAGAVGTLLPPPPELSAERNFSLGVLLASRNAFAEAVPYLEATLRAVPASHAASYNLALAYKGAGRNQDAIDLIERAIHQHPTAELYNLLASIEEIAGKYVEAVQGYQRAVELEPSNEQYYFDLGAEYLTHFTFGPALEVFQVGTEKFPRSARQHLGMGLANFALRQYAEAAEAFLGALEIDPSSTAAFAAWNALPPFLAPAEWEGIRTRLQRLAEVHPQSAQALYCYGATLFRHSLASGGQEDFGIAESLLERAIRLDPRLSEAHLELAALYAARKENEKAVAGLLEAIRLDPDSEMAHYRLGQAYRDLNRLQLAQQELARYAELTRSRREKMARSRSAIKQFILAQSGSGDDSAPGKVLEPAGH